MVAPRRSGSGLLCPRMIGQAKLGCLRLDGAGRLISIEAGRAAVDPATALAEALRQGLGSWSPRTGGSPGAEAISNCDGGVEARGTACQALLSRREPTMSKGRPARCRRGEWVRLPLPRKLKRI